MTYKTRGRNFFNWLFIKNHFKIVNVGLGKYLMKALFRKSETPDSVVVESTRATGGV